MTSVMPSFDFADPISNRNSLMSNGRSSMVQYPLCLSTVRCPSSAVPCPSPSDSRSEPTCAEGELHQVGCPLPLSLSRRSEPTCAESELHQVRCPLPLSLSRRSEPTCAESELHQVGWPGPSPSDGRSEPTCAEGELHQVGWPGPSPSVAAQNPPVPRVSSTRSDGQAPLPQSPLRTHLCRG